MHTFIDHERMGYRSSPISWNAMRVMVTALGLALVIPFQVQAKTFHCGAMDVACLIASINEANANGKRNTIRLEVGTYTLDNSADGANGLPSVTSVLTIRGKGSAATIIERAATAPLFRLFHTAATGHMRLEHLTVRGGWSAEFRGGGIFNHGRLILANCLLTENTVDIGPHELIEGGGGLFTDGVAVIENSTITLNTVVGEGGGGGILNRGTLTIRESAITSNFGDVGGGGLLSSGITRMVNSTVAHNTSRSRGGGIADGTLLSLNSTIANNHAGAGGGIASFSAGVVLQNTILARNTIDPTGQGPDCWVTVTSLGNNLIGDPTDCTVALLETDLTGDPGLSDFTDNGEPGNGHFSLLPTSQAIDAGNDAMCPRIDQLGRRRVGLCDIGAVRFREGREFSR
jgi:hypothetical protein